MYCFFFVKSFLLLFLATGAFGRMLSWVEIVEAISLSRPHPGSEFSDVEPDSAQLVEFFRKFPEIRNLVIFAFDQLQGEPQTDQGHGMSLSEVAELVQKIRTHTHGALELSPRESHALAEQADLVEKFEMFWLLIYGDQKAPIDLRLEQIEPWDFPLSLPQRLLQDLRDPSVKLRRLLERMKTNK